MNPRIITSLIVFLLFSFASLDGQVGTTYYSISTVAGKYELGDEGPASKALLFGPRGVAIDKAGNLYVADARNSRLRKITPQGVITTVAILPLMDVAVDAAGENIYVLSPEFVGDLTAAKVYRVNPDGKISEFVGNGQLAFGGDGGDAKRASIQASAIAVDAQGNLYIADEDNHRIRRVSTDGTIRTIAGSGVGGFTGDGGPATEARLRWPGGVAVRDGVVYVADSYNHRIRRITADGVINTVAGTGVPGISGDGGLATLAQFAYPRWLAFDGAGNLYVSSNTENRIRRINPAGMVNAFAGTGAFGFSGDGGAAAGALFYGIGGMATDANSVYVADQSNDRLRRIDAKGEISTFAGASHYAGDGGAASAAVMKFPAGLALDRSGNVYVSDSENHRIRVVDGQGTIRSYAGNGVPGTTDGPLAQARLAYPYGLTFDSGGNLFFADYGTSRIRRINREQVVAAVAGNGTAGYGGDNSLAVTARLNGPSEVAIDEAGNLYIADTYNHRIRKVTPEGAISTVAGDGNAGFAGDGGRATQARLFQPRGVAVDRQGNVYISDTYNNRVRKVDINGVITTFAGNGQCCSMGDNGPATNARMGLPYGLAFDAAGNLFIAELFGDQIRRVAPNGTITTVAGNGERGFSGDGGVAQLARLNGPVSIAVGQDGSIYFTDVYNHRVRKLTPLVATGLSVVRGDGQTAEAGSALPAPLTVKASTRDGVGVPGIQITYTVVSGTASLSAETVVSGLDGTASVNAKFGTAAGEVRVRAVASGFQAVFFTLTATPAVIKEPLAPVITPEGIASAGGSTPPLRVLAPNSQAWVNGENFVADGSSRELGAADLTEGALPLTLNGVCVLFGGVRAPVYAVSAKRIGVIVPEGTGEVPVEVVAGCGGENERRSKAEPVTIQTYSPEFYFSANAGEDGKRAVQMRNEAGERILSATPGDTVVLRMTGLGPVSPALTPGSVPAETAALVEAPKVVIGDSELAGENIVFAGAAAEFPGLYDVRVKLPAEIAEGDLAIVVTVGGVSTAGNAVLPVRTASAPTAAGR